MRKTTRNDYIAGNGRFKKLTWFISVFVDLKKESEQREREKERERRERERDRTRKREMGDG